MIRVADAELDTFIPTGDMVCADTCAGMRVDMCVDVCVDMCVGTRTRTRRPRATAPV